MDNNVVQMKSDALQAAEIFIRAANAEGVDAAADKLIDYVGTEIERAKESGRLLHVTPSLVCDMIDHAMIEFSMVAGARYTQKEVFKDAILPHAAIFAEAGRIAKQRVNGPRGHC